MAVIQVQGPAESDLANYFTFRKETVLQEILSKTRRKRVNPFTVIAVDKEGSTAYF